MSLTRTVEFDAFGPWILPVTTREDVPRAFHDHPFDFDHAFILKVPRNIERRNANPGMHLYDRMLIVDATGLTVLTRLGDGFDITTIAADAIGAVEHSSELLDGALTVHDTAGARVEVPFNSVSTDIVVALAKRLVDLSGSTSPHEGPSDPMQIDALSLRDIALANAYRDAAAKTPGLRVLAAYAGSTPTSKESLGVRLITRRARLSGAVICGNASELVVLSRRSWVHRGGKPDLSTKHTVLVKDRITAVDSADHPLLHAVALVTVALGDASLTFEVPAEGAAVSALRWR